MSSEKSLCVLLDGVAMEDKACAFAEENGLRFIQGDQKSFNQNAIVYSLHGVCLQFFEGKKKLEVRAEFFEGASAHRRHFGGGKGQSIAKAVGVKANFLPHVIDATAGLGRDAFVLACLGLNVTLLERSAVVAELLDDGIQRAKRKADDDGDIELQDILSRMNLIKKDSLAYLAEKNSTADVVYLDPMFPERKKSALVKKEMRAFHEIVGMDPDADGLLQLGINAARYRVVVKRPRIAPFLSNQKPSYQLEGKSNRFDIYTKKALP